MTMIFVPAPTQHLPMTQVSLATLVAGVLSGDCLVSFPTDTVPALAARPDRAELIFAAKQRSPEKPLILMGATPECLWPFVMGRVEEWQVWKQVAEQHWPGALTLVLPASDRLPPAMNPADPTTIGLRVPNQAIAQQILQQTGPLATTSANRSGQPPLQTMAEIEAQFPDVLILQPSQLESLDSLNAELANPSPVPETAATKSALGVPSTVAKWTGSSWTILRQGAVKLENV